MNFFTHKIVNPAGPGISFNEWLANEIVKVAEKENGSSAMAKPECDDDPRGQCRGQVINNDNRDGAGYQKGESVSGKKEQGGNARPDSGGTTDQKENKQKDKEALSASKVVKAKCGKEMGESHDAGKVTEKHTDAGPGDDQNSEPKMLINNDPNYQKGESVSGKKNKKNDGKKDKKASHIMKFEKISSMDRRSRLAVFAMLMSTKQYPIEYVEAMTDLKVANLKDDEKKWFSDFWEILYPPDYVGEMSKDR